jgi:hypothetical protein
VLPRQADRLEQPAKAPDIGVLASDRWLTRNPAQVCCACPDLFALERPFDCDFRTVLLGSAGRTPSCVGECHKEGYGDYVPMRRGLLEHDNSPGMRFLLQAAISDVGLHPMSNGSLRGRSEEVVWTIRSAGVLGCVFVPVNGSLR